MTPLQAPQYSVVPPWVKNRKVALAVESMRNHMTDEGWQIMLGLEEAGYQLFGGRINSGVTDVRRILDIANPSVVFLQDKREWLGRTAGAGFDERERFTNIEALRDLEDVFKVTIVKDAHNDQQLQKEFAEEIRCQAWVVYYHPGVVCDLAPYIRRQHVIRTYHSVDARAMPLWRMNDKRLSTVISGAVSAAYPLRKRLIDSGYFYHLLHPGYGRDRCYTSQYLDELSRYRVSICTASRYGYALRKIVESTAVGCSVITDLPACDKLPGIDGNLIRVNSSATLDEVREIADNASRNWDETKQELYANIARELYDYRYLGKKLATDIDALRSNYAS